MNASRIKFKTGKRFGSDPFTLFVAHFF